MHIRTLFFLGILSFAALPCAAETIVRNPQDSSALLAYAEEQESTIRYKIAKGELSYGRYHLFGAKVAEYRNWYNCVQMDPVWAPGSPVMLRISSEEFDFTEGNIGPDVGLASNVETTMTKLTNPVTGTRIQIGYDVANPILPGMGAYYLLGTYTNDVVLVVPGSGYWSALSNEALQEKLCHPTKAFGGLAEVDRQQFNRMLVDIYKDIGLPLPLSPPTLGRKMLYLLVGVSVVALLVVPLVLRLVFLRKRRGKDCCPLCGSPMERGVCPRCGPGGIIIDPLEVCPICGSRLVDGMCPNGDAAVDPFHCPDCHAILENGVCPNGCMALEICPSCGSELVDGICPNGCTIVRCPACNGILMSGACPKGCAPRALNLGWPGATKPTMAPWKLEVAEPAGFAGEACELPFEAVIGRSASERKTTGAYVQLHFDDRRKSCECPRRYVKLVCDPATKEVTVEMLSRVGRAVVDGKTLSATGDKAVLPESGILDLPPTGYRLKLVRASAEASELRGDDDKPVGQMKRTFRR